MKNKSMLKLLLSIGGIVLLVLVALYGLPLGEKGILPVAQMVKKGLDIQGGVSVVYEAQTDQQGEELDKTMNQTLEVFRSRVDSMGVTEPELTREGVNRIRIELPGAKNAEEAIKTIGKTAQLQFMTTDKKVVLTGAQVKTAGVGFDQNNRPIVNLEFNEEGAKAFAEASTRLAGTEQPIQIVLDNEVISSPIINEPIPNGKGQISGNFTVESAQSLAALINAGALPVEFKEVQTQTIQATLGADALSKSLKGAFLGVALVMLFMLFFYRVSGLAAVLALVVYILIVLYVYSMIGATLTLPGIAALILSVGMAVDANVIIFERVKEELREAKSVRLSVDNGFKKAMSTIVDSQITTFIAGIVLFYFGTGPIQGFAVTLMIGIVASLFTAIVVTRFLLKNLLQAIDIKNSKFFGA